MSSVDDTDALVPRGVRALRRPGITLIPAPAAERPAPSPAPTPSPTPQKPSPTNGPPQQRLTKHPTQPVKAPTTAAKAPTQAEGAAKSSTADAYRAIVFKTSIKAEPNTALVEAAHRQGGAVAAAASARTSVRPEATPAKKHEAQPTQRNTSPPRRQPDEVVRQLAPTAVEHVAKVTQRSIKRLTAENARDRTPQVHMAREQSIPEGKQKPRTKQQALVPGGETFAPPHRVLSQGIHRVGLSVVSVARLSRNELIRMIANPHRLRSEIATIDAQIRAIEFAVESQQSPELVRATIPLETQRAKLEAALNLTEGRLKTQTEQALKRRGTRFFVDVIDRVRMTRPEVEDLTIGKQADKTGKKQIQVVGALGGEEIVISTKGTSRNKTTIRAKLKNPALSVDVGAKINWLTPRTHNKSQTDS